MKIKVGFGFDVHQLTEERALWLGGVKIENAGKGALGHSDADVLIHAIADALLGAAKLNDIGYHFKNTDPRWKDIDSKIILREVCKMVREKGYEISNVDSYLTLESPKIGPYVEAMCNCLAEVMGIDPDDVSVKATTNETMGYVGRGEGVNAYAVVLVTKG